MKKLLMIFSLAIAACSVQAQTPAPDPDTLKNPVKQTDPEVKQEPADIHYVDEMTRINADELPAAVLDSLKKAEPTAWEKSVVYKSRKNDQFTVEVRDGGQEKKYRFNKEGRHLKTLDQEDKK
jgi:hypothetical protein